MNSDAERLDWLEQLTDSDAILPLVRDWRWKGKRYPGGLRDAIDAATRVEPVVGLSTKSDQQMMNPNQGISA